MKFVSLKDASELSNFLNQSMEENSDWKEILPWLKTMVDRCGRDTLPIITLAYDEESFVGFFVIAEQELLKEQMLYTPWLCILMIFDKFRGHGYSPMMIEEACRETKAAGYDALYLATEHIRYYERFGFEEIGLGIYQWGSAYKDLQERFIGRLM